MLEQIQAWLSSLPGNVVIQTKRNGQVVVAIQDGPRSIMAVRPSFVEAAEACLQQVKCASIVNNG